MSTKRENLEPGKGCLSCAHNKNISIFLDMYRLATDGNDERQNEGIEYMEDLRDNLPKRTTCRFYKSDNGILKSYLVERNTYTDGTCEDYEPVTYVATKETRKRKTEEDEEDFDDDNLEEITDDSDEDDLEMEDSDYEVDED